MTERMHPSPARPARFDDRYRLYLGQSGDHVFRETNEIAHRYAQEIGRTYVPQAEDEARRGRM